MIESKHNVKFRIFFNFSLSLRSRWCSPTPMLSLHMEHCKFCTHPPAQDRGRQTGMMLGIYAGVHVDWIDPGLVWKIFRL